MVFDLTKMYVPESYADSRDYRIFLRQLGVISTVLKYNIDKFTDLYDPEECPDHMLPLLATMVGYSYKEEKSIKDSRKIIKYFPYMVRKRGSEEGIKLAAVISVNTSTGSTRSYSSSDIVVETRVEEGLIRVYYPYTETVDWDLIEVVRPVGMRVETIPSDFAFLSEELDVKVTARSHQRHRYLDDQVYSKVRNSQVGFTVNTPKDYRNEED